MNNKKSSSVQISKTFKFRLLDILEESLTKEDFCKNVGVSMPTLNRMVIYGIIPPTDILLKIADNLNLPTDYILGISDKSEFYKSANTIPFYLRLQQLTTERKTTLNKIAAATNLPINYFYKWIKNKSVPCVPFLISIAEYFHVSLDYLLGRTDER